MYGCTSYNGSDWNCNGELKENLTAVLGTADSCTGDSTVRTVLWCGRGGGTEGSRGVAGRKPTMMIIIIIQILSQCGGSWPDSNFQLPAAAQLRSTNIAECR
jgi:hypothetical protein